MIHMDSYEFQSSMNKIYFLSINNNLIPYTLEWNSGEGWGRSSFLACLWVWFCGNKRWPLVITFERQAIETSYLTYIITLLKSVSNDIVVNDLVILIVTFILRIFTGGSIGICNLDRDLYCKGIHWGAVSVFVNLDRDLYSKNIIHNYRCCFKVAIAPLYF